MTKKELICSITDALKERDERKEIRAQQMRLKVVGEGGQEHTFVVKDEKRTVMYNQDDVDRFFTAMIDIIEDAVRRGDTITIPGFGSLFVKYKSPHRMAHPVTGEPMMTKGRYYPSFSPGHRLKMAACAYSLIVNENNNEEDEAVDEDLLDIEENVDGD